MAKIAKIYIDNRKSPFGIKWTENQKRLYRFFETEREREDFIQKTIYLDTNAFAAILKLDQDSITQIAKMEEARGEVTYKEIWDFWAKHHKAVEIIDLWSACNEYIKYLKPNVCIEYCKHARVILEKLCHHFQDIKLIEITRNDLEHWLNNLPYSDVTKNNYRSTIRASWGFFLKNNFIEKNIATTLSCPVIRREEIKFLSVPEVEKLLRANEEIDPDVCGLLALGLFAGMRDSAIPRLAYEEITFGEGILTPAEKTKKGRRNYIENLPPNLWAWLSIASPEAFTWCERKWKRRKEFAFRRAGLLCNAIDVKKLKAKGIKAELILPPKNGIRHSFASYHVAWKRDFQDTALIMSHKGTNILFEHYRGNASQANAEKYFNIYPKVETKEEVDTVKTD